MHSWTRYGPFGGHVFLDFVNTVDDEGKTRTLDALPDWPTVLAWAGGAGLISESEAVSLAAPPKSDDGAACRELAEIHAFRERAWRLLDHLATGGEAPAADLRAVETTIRWALERAALVPRDGVFAWSADGEICGLAIIRTRLALALADLLAQPDLARLRECDRCTGLYLDHGRGRGRRWCRMATCGNRAKVERFRRR